MEKGSRWMERSANTMVMILNHILRCSYLVNVLPDEEKATHTLGWHCDSHRRPETIPGLGLHSPSGHKGQSCPNQHRQEVSFHAPLLFC